jgi:hypothetical protein
VTKSLIALCAALVGAGAAHAQTTSDLQPPPPPPPAAGTGSFGNYQPGMPIPQPPAPPGAPAKAEGAGRGHYVMPDESGGLDEEEESAVAISSERPPSTHVVKKGDTLWELSASYYKNPWLWPKLWALNPSITNPHWIYPGDVVRLSAEPAPVAVAPAVAPAPTRAPPPTAPTRAMPVTGLFLRQTGFVEPGELEQAGRLVGSKEEKTMLATLDEAYVSFDKRHPLVPGQRYTVYRTVREVKHPTSGKRLGHMVEIFGEVEVRSVTDGNIARVIVTDSIDPIERGFLVGPLRRQFKVVEPRPADRDQEGVVVTTLQPRDLVGAGSLVFIDRGQKDGVEVGNRFFVVRRGDGYLPLLSKGPVDDKRFPRENIAEVLIVDLRDQLATGLVVKSNKEARIGDRVEARAGY